MIFLVKLVIAFWIYSSDLWTPLKVASILFFLPFRLDTTMIIILVMGALFAYKTWGAIPPQLEGDLVKSEVFINLPEQKSLQIQAKSIIQQDQMTLVDQFKLSLFREEKKVIQLEGLQGILEINHFKVEGYTKISWENLALTGHNTSYDVISSCINSNNIKCNAPGYYIAADILKIDLENNNFKLINPKLKVEYKNPL